VVWVLGVFVRFVRRFGEALLVEEHWRHDHYRAYGKSIASPPACDLKGDDGVTEGKLQQMQWLPACLNTTRLPGMVFLIVFILPSFKNLYLENR
jgi:hypothetical protein